MSDIKVLDGDTIERAGGMSASLARRLATIDMLSRSIAENLPKGLPGLIDVPIAENRSSSTQIASGTFYGFSSTTPASHFPNHYSFYGGDWSNFYSTNYLIGVNYHGGNGSDPSSGPGTRPSVSARFVTHADKFELYIQNYLGFRVLVNGKYLKTGAYGVSALNGDAGSGRWFLFDFAGTEFAGTGLKQVEVQAAFDEFRLGGAKVPIAHTIAPWPQAMPLKCALHGDSMPGTVSDTGTDYRTSLHGLTTLVVQRLTGIADIWANNIGGAGFIADTGGTRSNFVEQATIDFSGKQFDLVWELGGRNDTPYYGSQAAYQAIVESWINIVLADNPDTIIVLTGPLTVRNAEAYQSAVTTAAVQDAKKAAAASFPRNCAFIETAGNAVTNDPWIFGEGKQGAPIGNGNADLVRGNDGVHPSVFGHEYLGTRLVAETARVLPLLASRIRDGVIEGVNDTDIA